MVRPSPLRDPTDTDRPRTAPSAPILSTGEPQAIVVRNLVKRYGPRTAVDGLSFEVGRGEVFALLGPNGAGKTTTVEILEGFRQRDDGFVRVLEADPGRDGATLKARIGLMPQTGGIYPQIRPLEALRLFASFYTDPDDPQSMLRRVGLGDTERLRYRQLSGGQQQRLSLAIALIGRPALVFLDEPTTGLDPQARRDTWSLIQDLASGGTTVFLTTHFMDEAEQLADRVAIINHGRLVTVGTPGEVAHSIAADHVRFRTSAPIELALLTAELGVPVHELGRCVYQIEAAPSSGLLATLTVWLARSDILMTELSAGNRSLEDAFLAYTRTESTA